MPENRHLDWNREYPTLSTRMVVVRMRISKYDVEQIRSFLLARWLLAWIPMPGGALATVMLAASGHYNPVLDDGIVADRLLVYWCHVGSQILVGVVVTTSSYRCVYRFDNQTRDVPVVGRDVKAGWLAQAIIVVVFGLVSWAVV